MRSFVLPFALIVSAAARGEDLSAVARRLEAEATRASLAKDLAYAERTYASDFVSIGLKGQRNSRAAVLQARKSLLRSYDPRSEVRKVVRVVPTKDGMVVTVDSWARGVLKDPLGGPGHRFEVRGRSDETWSRSAGVWKMRSTRVRAVSTALDGKPLAGSPRRR